MKFTKLFILMIILTILVSSAYFIFTYLIELQKYSGIITEQASVRDGVNTSIQIIIIFIIELIAISLLAIYLSFTSEILKDFTLASDNKKLEGIISTEIDLGELKDEIRESEIENQYKQRNMEFMRKYTDVNIHKTELTSICKQLLSDIGKIIEIVEGEIYLLIKINEQEKLKLTATYAYTFNEIKQTEFEIGEGLIGQVAKSHELININNIPEGYITVLSGLGKATPKNLIIFPLLFHNNLIGIIELAAFKPFHKFDETLFMDISERFGEIIYKFGENPSIYMQKQLIE